VTLTFVDTNSATLADTKITVKGTGITGTTDTSGQVVFNLDDGTYTLVNPSTATHEGEENSVTVSGDTSETITITARTIPSPPTADYCTVFVSRVWSPETRGTGASTIDVAWSDEDSDELDANGCWQLFLLRGAVVDIEVELTNGDMLKRRRVIIPDVAQKNWRELEVEP